MDVLLSKLNADILSTIFQFDPTYHGVFAERSFLRDLKNEHLKRWARANIEGIEDRNSFVDKINYAIEFSLRYDPNDDLNMDLLKIYTLICRFVNGADTGNDEIEWV